MNEKIDRLEQIREIIRDQNGVIHTSDLTDHDIPRQYLTMLVKKGEVLREARGVYSTPHAFVDEMAVLQTRTPTAIFSHETALYLHDLTDRTPLSYSVTVPSGYNATSMKERGIKVFFVKRDLHLLGKRTVISPQGNELAVYDVERTICDVVRSRNQMDSQLANEALKRYVRYRAKDIDKLYRYARQFRVQRIIREYIEVLL
jgi:predicted transcriptional regulator of viral defense system